MEERNIFVLLSNWCRSVGASYNMDFNGSYYSFAIRLTDCGTLASSEFIILLSVFEDTSDKWYTIVNFDKDCIRITYDRKQNV